MMRNVKFIFKSKRLTHAPVSHGVKLQILNNYVKTTKTFYCITYLQAYSMNCIRRQVIQMICYVLSNLTLYTNYPSALSNILIVH